MFNTYNSKRAPITVSSVSNNKGSRSYVKWTGSLYYGEGIAVIESVCRHTVHYMGPMGEELKAFSTIEEAIRFCEENADNFYKGMIDARERMMEEE